MKKIMEMFTSSAIGAACLLGATASTDAATFIVNASTDATLGSCINDDISSGAAISVICTSNGLLGTRGVAIASIEGGRMSAIARTSSQAGLLEGVGGVGDFGRPSKARARYWDNLTFGISSGSFVVPIDILGDLTLTGPSDADTTGSYAFTLEAASAEETPTGRTFQSDVGFAGEVRTVQRVALPFSGGQLRLRADLSVFTPTCGVSTIGQSCETISSFSNSVRFLGASIFDADGNLVPDATISSSSGFDYVAGFEPHAIAAVPLPASLPLMLAGLLAMSGFSFLRSRN